MTQNIAAITVSLDGIDLTDKIAPRLISCTICDKRGEKADQLDLVLHDHDGKLAIPKEGALLKVQMGWKQGDDVKIGMVDKGTFKVDEAEHSGPPDIITIRARSANMTAGFRVRKDKVHKETTIGAIVSKVASDNGWTPHIEGGLGSITVPAHGQSARSDMAMLRELGHKHDATATVKNGKLIFAPIGTGKTASGKSLPAITITRKSGNTHRYTKVARDQYDGVEAQYHDHHKAKRFKVTSGHTGTGTPRRLKKVHATKANAEHHAKAEAGRNKRRAAEFEYDLAFGQPDLAVEQPVTLKGWKDEIDNHKWVIAEATHELTASNGLTTKLKLDTAA